MKREEIGAICIAIVILTGLIAFKDLLANNFLTLGISFLGATIIIVTNIAAKLVMARSFDADVEHQIWTWERYGFKPGYRLSKPVPLGIVISVVITLLSAGYVKWCTLLSYETTAHPGGKRKFAGYSFTEMTDWHNAVVGASGIIATLLVSFIAYWIPPAHMIAQAAAFYAFFNMIPFSRLDGAQIFFGSRVLWTALALITVLFAFTAAVIII